LNCRLDIIQWGFHWKLQFGRIFMTLVFKTGINEQCQPFSLSQLWLFWHLHGDMMTTRTMPEMEYNDTELVAQSLAGNRIAFGQIVARYQTLICSLAYSATGSLTQSEDLSQETFVTAWKQLSELREPGKLRSWLCGIVRNLSRHTVRGQGHEPVYAAVPLETVQETAALEAHPLAQAISREEQAILWRSLERIPVIYREPLILFYREQESVEQVAQALELSEAAVRQRLSRGRKLLQEEIATFVEGALRQTKPGQEFSSAVLAALPLAASSAATAGVGAGAKGTAAAKSGFLATWLAPFTPFLGIAAGVGAQCLIIRAATTDRRLRVTMMAQAIIFWVVVIGLAWGGEIAVRSLGDHFQWSSQVRFVALAIFWWSYCCALVTAMSVMARRNLAFGTRSREASETAPPAVAPMNPGILAVVVAGVHLALFFPLIRVAWNADDLMAAWTIAGTAVMLCVLAFFRVRGKTGTDIARASSEHLGICCVVLLMALNLRFDIWVASAYGVTVAEVHHLQPTWIVPVLSLAFMLWAGAMSTLTKPKPRLQ
jgi:RNA polymerase sigma factor (sigma-70 family)